MTYLRAPRFVTTIRDTLLCAHIHAVHHTPFSQPWERVLRGELLALTSVGYYTAVLKETTKCFSFAGTIM